MKVKHEGLLKPSIEMKEVSPGVWIKAPEWEENYYKVFFDYPTTLSKKRDPNLGIIKCIY